MKMLKECAGRFMFESFWTWNLIYAGICPLMCAFCFVFRYKRKKIAPLTFREKALKEDLGTGKNIFVNASYESFLPAVKQQWWEDIVAHCAKFPGNRYLVDTKRPDIMRKMMENGLVFPDTFTLAVSIEGNRDHRSLFSAACPTVAQRVKEFKAVDWDSKAVVFDPALDFDVDPTVDIIREIKPKIICFGIATCCNCAPPPPIEKSVEFIEKALEITKVYILAPAKTQYLFSKELAGKYDYLKEHRNYRKIFEI